MSSHSSCKLVSFGDLSLIMGMEWFAVIGPDARAEALRVARRYTAQYMFVPTQESSSIAIANIDAKQKQKLFLVCAAHLVKHEVQSQTSITITRINNDCWWLVGFHNGSVMTRTDKLVSTYDQAISIANDISLSYTDIKFFEYENLPAILVDKPDISIVASAKLQLVPYKKLSYLTMCCLIFIGMAAFSANYFINSYPKVSDQYNQAHSYLWQQAQNKVFEQLWVHGTYGTKHLLDSIHSTPVILSGWGLQSIECLHRLTSWQCSAVYKRLLSNATNQHLHEALPVDWAVEYLPMEQAKASWTVVSMGRSLANIKLNSHLKNNTTLISNLQSISRAINNIYISAPLQIRVTPPHDKSGSPLPPPSNLLTYQNRLFEVRAPLRSVILLIPHLEHVGWRRLSIAVKPTRQASILESMFVVTMYGDLYELS